MERVSRVTSKRNSTKLLVKISLLSAIAFVLMFVEMPIPGLFPSFLKIDISDIPALIAGFALGPIAGLAVEGVKNFLHFITATSTGGVGELANVVVGGAFVVTASTIYTYKKNLRGIVLGFIVATIVMTFIGSVMNYFVMLPFYGKFMGMEAIIGMGKAVNPNVNDLLSFVLWFIAPFNLIKGILISVMILPMYKKLDKFFKLA